MDFYWSSTKVNTANYCGMRYYLRYMAGKKSARLSAYVKGSLLHSAVEHFWDRLGTPEEVASTSKQFKDKKYSDAAGFVKHLQGKWWSIVIADRSAEEKMSWRYESEPFVIKGQLKPICTALFDHLVKIGPPIFSELPFDFQIEDERFKGRIDEVRKAPDGKISVIDYKSGRPWIGAMKLAHDPQLTLYNVGLCSMIKSYPKIQAALGLEGRVEEFMGGGRFVSPNLREGFFMIESLSIDPAKVKTMPEVIYETTRTDENFFEFLKMIRSVKRRASEGDVYPERGKKCDDCDVRIDCDLELKRVNTGTYCDKKGNGVFDFASPAYSRKDDIGEISSVVLEPEKPPAPLTKSQMNKIQPPFHFRYKKPAETPTNEKT